MTFERDGFFSAQAEVFRVQTRETEAFKAWFDYALGLNRSGYEILRRLGTLTDLHKIALNTSFVRVHKSFQSVLILSERGLVQDAQAVLRTAVEWTIAIHALAKDGYFLDRMIEASHRSNRAYAVKSRASGALLSAGSVAGIDKAIREAEAYQTSLGMKLRRIVWEDVAEQHCSAPIARLLYQVLYRDLSSDGTHATTSALDRLLGVEENGQITAVMAGPLTAGRVDLLRHASLIFLLSARVCAEMNPLADVSAMVDKAEEELCSLDETPPPPPTKSPSSEPSP